MRASDIGSSGNYQFHGLFKNASIFLFKKCCSVRYTRRPLHTIISCFTLTATLQSHIFIILFLHAALANPCSCLYSNHIWQPQMVHREMQVYNGLGTIHDDSWWSWPSISICVIRPVFSKHPFASVVLHHTRSIDLWLGVMSTSMSSLNIFLGHWNIYS